MKSTLLNKIIPLHLIVIIPGLLLLGWLGLPQAIGAELLPIEKRGGLAGAYFYQDKTPDSIEVFLLIQSGGFDDGDGPEGLAHYLEHLVWLSAVDPDGRASMARDDGARVTGGLTIYDMKGRPDALGSFLATMAKVFAPPSLDEQFMLEELDIIQREYDFRVSESRTYPIVRELVTHLFGDAPRARSDIGTPESIAQLTPEAALDLHARTHVPANAVLLIVGNADLATAESLVDQHLGGIAPGSPPPRRVAPPFEERREIIETSVGGLSGQQLIYFKRIRLDTPIAEDRLQLRLDLLEAILASTLEGSLAKPLRYDDFIARGFSLGLSAIEPGEVLMTFSAAPDEGIALPDLLNAFEDTLSAIADKGVPHATFDRIRKKRLSALDAVKGKRGTVIRLVISQIGDGEAPIDPKSYIKRYGLTTLEDVNGLVGALTGPGDVAAALISPDNSE